jgi:urea transport system permease protein
MTTLRNAKLDATGWSTLVVVAAFAAFPAFANDYQTSILAKFLAFAIFALSLDLIWGYAGVVNFGHAIFFGLGAYGMGVTLRFIDMPGATYLAVLAAILVPMLCGIVLGYFLFYGRVGGVFFGVVTLALTGVVQSIIIVSIDLTGGMNGLYDYPIPLLGVPGLWEFEWFGADVPYYIALAGALGCWLLARWIVNSDLGRALRGIRENEDRVEFLGYNVPLLKLVIFAISCGMAGFSGALYVPVGFISPELAGLAMSASVLVWVAVGGRGTLVGALIGALVVNYLQTLLSDALVVLWLLIVGLFFILVVLFWPGGVVGAATSPWTRRRLAALLPLIRPKARSDAAH